MNANLLRCMSQQLALHVGTGGFISCPVPGGVRKQVDVAALPRPDANDPSAT
jgi:hypothetical protein